MHGRGALVSFVLAFAGLLALSMWAPPAQAQDDQSPPAPPSTSTYPDPPSLPPSREVPRTASDAVDAGLFGLALRLAIAECSMGQARSCELAGEIFRKGYSGEADLERAVQYYRLGCDLGRLAACNTLAVAQYELDPEAPNTPEMTQLQVNTCKFDYAIGCSNAGWRYEHGVGVEADPAFARALYIKSCELGSSSGCLNTAIAYDTPIGGELDYDKALQAYRYACQSEDLTGCYWVAAYQQMGRAMPKDETAAFKAFEELCEADHAKSCASVGWSLREGLGTRKGFKRAREVNRKACDLGYADGCNLLGLLYENGRGGKKDLIVAMAIFREGCGKKSGSACMNQSRLIGMSNPALAIRLLDRACEYGQKRACEIRAME